MVSWGGMNIWLKVLSLTWERYDKRYATAYSRTDFTAGEGKMSDQEGQGTSTWFAVCFLSIRWY